MMKEKYRQMKVKIKQIWQKLFFIMVNTCLPLPAMAYSSTDKLSSIFDDTIDLITGEWGTSLAVLAIMGVGFSWMKLGKIDKEYAIGTILGIGLVYSAAYIVKVKYGID